MLRPLAFIFSLISAVSALAVAPVDSTSQLIISVRDQKLMLVQNGGKVATDPISPSLFGFGDAKGGNATPLGYMAGEEKIGDKVTLGPGFHNPRPTRAILHP